MELNQKAASSDRPDDQIQKQYNSLKKKHSSDSLYSQSTVISWLSNVTLEPMLFLKMVAEGNFKVIADTLEIDRICKVNLNYSDLDCSSMDDGNHSDIQNEVQIYQNIFNYRQSLMDSFIPLLIIILIGPLSDVYGRKPALISVLIGFIGFGVVYILTALNSTWPVQVLYLATLSVDLSGTWVVFNMAVYSYIADVTQVESRTKRMSIAAAISSLGGPAGTMLGGYIYKAYGYVAVYGISTCLWSLCLLYTIFFIRESKAMNGRYNKSHQKIERNRCGTFRHVTGTFKTVFRRRPGNGRMEVISLIGLKLGVFLVQGHQVYLWSRKVLQWNVTKYSTWSSAEEGSHQAGMLIWVWIGETRRFHNCTVAGGGLFSIMLWSVALACITGPSLWWLTIVASFLGLLEASIEPAIRSMLTAVVRRGEEGKVLSMLGMIETLWLSVDRALYTILYNKFVNSFPQINFCVQAAIALSSVVVVWLLKRKMVQGDKVKENVELTAVGKPMED